MVAVNLHILVNLECSGRLSKEDTPRWFLPSVMPASSTYRYPATFAACSTLDTVPLLHRPVDGGVIGTSLHSTDEDALKLAATEHVTHRETMDYCDKEKVPASFERRDGHIEASIWPT
jgi:hypothetical protein